MASKASKGTSIWRPGGKRGGRQVGPFIVITDPNGKVPTGGKSATPGVLVQAGVFRFRWQLVPLAWLAAVALAGRILQVAHAVKISVIISVVACVTVLLLTRHLKGWPRFCTTLMAVLAGVWLPVLTITGMGTPRPALLLVSYVAVAAPWSHHYKWRQPKPGHRRERTDIEIWEEFAEKRLPGSYLAEPGDIPGGRTWTIMLKPGHNTPGDVVGLWPRIAGAWDKPRTECYPEPYPDGRESRAKLTILKRDSMSDLREWDGSTIDVNSGLAVVGRFPDGKPVHEAFFAPMSGARHSIVAGADGSGKTAMLDLGLCISATSGLIVPIVLDPQEGQALPAWRDHVLYAAGIEECLVMLEGIHAGMLDRSKYLGSLRWQDDDGDWHKGMQFFDTRLNGLPLVEVTLDEAPAFLTDPIWGDRAVWLAADGVKRGRKTGTRYRIAAQVPSLAELGAQALRSMLVGGNVTCLRTGDRMSGGMVLMEADPSELPKYFANGQMTYGLGYHNGPDQRPGAPMRLDWVRKPAKIAASANIPRLDERFAEAMDRAMRDNEMSKLINDAASPVPAAAVSPSSSATVAPNGRTVTDAILVVLGQPMQLGAVLVKAGDLGKAWGLPKPFATTAVADALKELQETGAVAQRNNDGLYVKVSEREAS